VIIIIYFYHYCILIIIILAIVQQHFHKKWQRRVKTWLDQPAQKKIRRERRKIKAAENSPRPASGALRPLVHCPTQKYSSKLKLGRGFTLEELKEAGINRQFAKSIGIAVDHRRTNKCTESLNLNVDRLKDYKSRLILFPRKAKKPTKGDATSEQVKEATQLKGPIAPVPKASKAVEFVDVSDELKESSAYATLRTARNDARLVGIRAKKLKEKEEKGEKPEKGDD